MRSSKFTPADLNQLPAIQPPDWGSLIPRFEYFIKSPLCHPIKIMEGTELVAVGTSIMHADTAWLACIVVHPNHRKKGLGNQITIDLIANIDQSKFKTIYLDATEFGFPVYIKLGFELEAVYTHMHHNGSVVEYAESQNVIDFNPQYLPQIFDVDQQVSGEDRSGVISDFIASSKLYVTDSKVEGFYIPGWGDAPIMAITEQAGAALIRRRALDENTAVLPSDNAFAIHELNALNYFGFKTSRRMFLGEKRDWQRTGVYNRISGQLG